MVDRTLGVPLKITVVRTGGLAGMRLEKSVDTATLDDGTQLETLVESAGLTDAAAGEAPYADRFSYEISTDDGRQLVVGESKLTAAQRGLVDRLMATA
jgi:hypothetical protein